jgi:CRISPR-associated protein Cas2
MRAIIAYDIPSDRRRTRAANVLMNYGERIQYSVFECNVSESRFDELREKLASLLNPRRDRLHIFPLCGACFSRAESIGPSYTNTLDY